MKKNVVRVLALVLVALMCLSLVPLAAHAEAHVHEMAEDHQDPTCVDNGFNQTYCPICGATFSMEYIPATGIHSFMNVVDEQYLIHEGDCEHAYQYWKSCSVCQQSAEEAYANALDAMYEELNNRKNSDEQADWEQIVKDRVLLLDEKYKFSYGGEGHHYIHVDHQEATCTSDGWKEYSYCDVCGEYFNYEVIPAKGHRWGEYTQTKAPTCTEAGEKVRVCEVCDEKDVVVLPALGHAWGEFAMTKAPTCTEDGAQERECSVCHEKEIQAIPALGHRFGAFKVTRPATCTVDGEQEHVCTVCGFKETEVIPAAHKWGEFVVIEEPGCYASGTQERTCSVCGEKQQESIPAAHKYGEFTVTQEPTCYSTGAKTAKCTVCGEEHTEWIDMVPHKYENGECVFCHIAMPEGYVAPSEDRTEITETAGSETENTDNQTVEPENTDNQTAETTDNQTTEPETLGTANENTEPEQQNAEPAAPVNTVTITFDGNGATGGSMEPQAFAEGSVQALSANAFTRDGYLFLGWDVAADGSAMGEDRFLDGEAVEVNSDVTLYAQWREINADVETQQTEASAETVSSFENVLNAQGLTEIDPAAMVVQNVTPLNADGSRMSNEEVAARGGVIFDMPLPDTYEKGHEIEVYHQNSETGEWERVTTYTVQGDKVVVCLKHFSPVVTLDRTALGGTLSPNETPMLGAAGTDGPFVVYFNANGGSVPSTDPKMPNAVKGNKGQTYPLPDVGSVIRQNHTLMGWNNQADGSGTFYAPGATYTFFDNETLYAQWDIRISYYPNGGTGGPMQSTPVQGTDVTLRPNVYTRTGYTFTGWNTEADGSGTYYPPENNYDILPDKTITITAPTSDLPLYAQWAKDSVNVSFDKNGAKGSETMDAKPVTWGDPLTLPANEYTNGEYTFTGWNTKSNGTGDSYDDTATIPARTLVKDTILYAQWSKTVYTVTYNKNTATGGTDMTPDTIDTSSKTSLQLKPNTYEKTNYDFIGWNTEADGSGTSYKDKEVIAATSFTENLILYAQWKQIKFTVKYDANRGSGSGAGDAEMTDDTIDTKTQTELTLKENKFTNTGYTFIGWNTKGDGSGDDYADEQTITADEFTEDLVLYAQWIIAIVFDKNNDAAEGTMSPQEITENPLKLKPNTFTLTDHTFDKWNTKKDGSGDSYADEADITDPTGMTLYAQWVKTKWAVTYDKNGGGGEDMTADSNPRGATGTVKESTYKAPDTSKIFGGWKDEKTGHIYQPGDDIPYLTDEQGEQIPVPADYDTDITLKAQWVAVVTISYHPGIGEGSYQTQDVPAGVAKKLKGFSTELDYKAPSGQTFAYWNGDDGEKYYNQQEVTLTDKLYLTADYGDTIVITYNANGGIYSTGRTERSFNAAQGKNYKLISKEKLDFSRKGYTFLGWALGSGAENPKYLDEDIVLGGFAQNTTLYAVWNQIAFEGIVTITGSVTDTDSDGYVGETLTADVTNETKFLGPYDYQWLRDGVEITGATNQTYTVTADDYGHRITCRVKAPDAKPDTKFSVNYKDIAIEIASKEIDIIDNVADDDEDYLYGLTDDMTYSFNSTDPAARTSVKSMLITKDGVKAFPFTKQGTYRFYNKGALIATVVVRNWYSLDYEITNRVTTTPTSSSSKSGSSGSSSGSSGSSSGSGSGSTTGTGTVVVKNGNTTLTTSSNIKDKSGNTIIKGNGTNAWLVREGANTDLKITVRPASSSYGFVYLNGSQLFSTSSERTAGIGTLTGPEHYDIIFVSSSSSPKTADMSRMGLWSALSFVSFVGLAGILVSARKRKNRG